MNDDYDVQYRTGLDNGPADAMSRLQFEDDGKPVPKSKFFDD